MKFIDNFLNKITMYRLVLYVLIFFLGASIFLSAIKALPYTPIDLITAVFFILSVSWITNLLFSYVYKSKTNVESVYITALILFFIITPPQGGIYSQFLALAFWASVWTVASKYLFTINKKHFFNPVAIAVVLVAFAIGQSATWWIGTANMLPFVLIGGLLVVRKIRRFDMVFSFLISALIAISIVAIFKGSDVPNTLVRTLKDSAFFFFAFIMLTEPLTAPSSKFHRIIFGGLVGILFLPQLHIGPVYSTPELALIVGNIFAYLVSPKEKLILKLKEKKKIANDTYDFIFENNHKFSFRPGEYMEWTLPHRSPDTRGNRRYFTIASSPSESNVRLGIKFYPEPSSFKNHLLAMPIGEEVMGAGRSGDFVLPKENKKGLVFIAGGIGVTPFRSMIKYLIDNNEKRNITMLYSNKTVDDIAYKEIFDEAENKLGIKTIYAITDTKENLTDKNMRSGFISADLIIKEIPNYTEKVFYISGPHGMVNAFEKTLTDMGVKNKNIKIDFFPGFA
ncbi:MAG: RnfABCDGE type electron transport complex subunit D [Candidatus Pacebacteria bacterium]|nr:RnfABCDGE type electron transport complex subunit D [Candidatus Paceibacterota bacterium]